ncbi:MAG: glycine--tRNA ligase subunit beta [Alphaproteobacteria bacterium]
MRWASRTRDRSAAPRCSARPTSPPAWSANSPSCKASWAAYYALAQGEKPEIADAIRDHYKPLGPNDSLPASDIGAIVALADKLDSITSLFAAGEKPTGSKDPFALRRAALGVLRILRARHLEARGEIDLALYANAEVIEFFRERLRGMLKDTIRHDAAEAAFHADRKGFDPCEVWARAQALLGMTQSDKATIEAIKRVLNILAAEEKKAKATFTFDAKKMQPLREPAEKELYAALKKAQGDIANAIESPPFALEALNTLTAPINLFFDNVLVNADEPGLREARLSLLAGIREAASQIADFSKIEG